MENVTNDIQAAFLQSVSAAFRAQKELAEKAIGQLSDAQLHEALDPNTNCVAVIMKHIGGNLRSRWTDFLTTDGEKTWRQRDTEFVDDISSRDGLFAHWERGWGCLLNTIGALGPDDLTRIVEIRGEAHSVVRAIHRALDHNAYHVGQIVLIARILAGDKWKTLSIPRGAGESEAFNRRMGRP